MPKKELIKSLAKSSKKHRSTLNDMANAALIEIEMGLLHGAMSTDALVALKQSTTEEIRPAILTLAKQSCNEKQNFPTKRMITKAKSLFFENQAINSDEFDTDAIEIEVKKTETSVSEKPKQKTKKSGNILMLINCKPPMIVKSNLIKKLMNNQKKNVTFLGF